MNIPPASPYCLIQEHLWPDRWKILVSCMMLNCTSRKQVDSVLPTFLKRWPSPEAFLDADMLDVTKLIKSLGLAQRRTNNLFAMTKAFIKHDWKDPRKLPGIGEYAARAYEIFCLGVFGTEKPKDGALGRYWDWCVLHGYGPGTSNGTNDV
jgi:methyl-CpG-binding domain protein 4